MQKKLLLIIYSLLFLISLCFGSDVEATNNYRFYDYPGFPDIQVWEANAINNNRQVVGNCQFYPQGPVYEGYTRGFLWSEQSGIEELGTLGGLYSNAHGINNLGQVVGSADLAGATSTTGVHACLWETDGTKRDLGVLGKDYSIASAINDSGKVVGWSFLNSGERRAFLWTAATEIQDLGGTGSTALAINSIGEIAGNAYGQICMWDANGNLRLLGSLGGLPHDWNQGRDINDNGVIVGDSIYQELNVHAFLWSEATELQDLGDLGGGDSTARGINNKNEVVGGAKAADGEFHAFIWTEVEGMLDLNDLAVDKPSDKRLEFAHSINDDGLIVGSWEDSTFHIGGFLLVPIGLPLISFFPPSLVNTCALGQNAKSQTFEVWNSGEGTLSYGLTCNQPWLSCTPTGGTSTGEPDTIGVIYSTSGLAIGTYNAAITITDLGANASPQQIPVKLEVKVGGGAQPWLHLLLE